MEERLKKADNGCQIEKKMIVYYKLHKLKIILLYGMYMFLVLFFMQYESYYDVSMSWSYYF